MLPEQMNDSQHELFFHVRRSIFYHERRLGFFEFWHRITSFLTVMLAGSFLFQFASSSPASLLTAVLGAYAATLAGIDVFIGFSKCADMHRDLKRRFQDLECQIMLGDGAKQTWSNYRAARLKIEMDEPAVYSALNVLCHNQTVMSLDLGKDQLKKLSTYQIFTAEFKKWDDVASSLPN